jgi:hypothetical protein
MNIKTIERWELLWKIVAVLFWVGVGLGLYGALRSGFFMKPLGEVPVGHLLSWMFIMGLLLRGKGN